MVPNQQISALTNDIYNSYVKIARIRDGMAMKFRVRIGYGYVPMIIKPNTCTDITLFRIIYNFGYGYKI